MYDLDSDPGELRNLFAGKPAVSQQMQSQLASTITTFTQGEGMAEKTPLDPALAERLKALGYTAFVGGGDPGVSNHNLPDPKDRIQFYETFSEAMDDGQHGNYAESAEKLTSLLKIEPDSLPVRYLLGINYYRLQRFPDAVIQFQNAVRLSPDYALANYWLGMSQARAGDLATAIASFQQALKLDKTNFSAAFNLGAAALRLGRTDQAAEAFQHSVTIYPEYAAGHMALGEVYLYQKKLEPAVDELHKAVTLQPENRAAHAALAKALEASGRHEEAVQQMKEAGAPNP